MALEPNNKHPTPTTAPPSPNSAESLEAAAGLSPIMPPVLPPPPAISNSADTSMSIAQTTSSVLEAVISGQLDELDKLGAERLKNVKDEDGMTPLLTAVRRGTPSTVLHLVHALSADLAECNSTGMTCIHAAAGRGGGVAVTMLEAIFSASANSEGHCTGKLDVDARDRQRFTPLHVACICGDEAVARCLLRRGAEVDAANDKGSTPLHWACSRGHTKIVKLLVGLYGADFTCPAGNGSTPLHWAASKDRRGVIRLLVGTFCAPVDVKDDKGCTPALMAALNGHLRAVELLVDRFQAKITAHDKKRTNLLHAACEMGHGELASALIERYKMGVEDEDRKGLTPLARAALRNQVEVVRLLVAKHGARLDVRTGRGSGLLHLACEGGALDVAKLLLHEHGFEVDARNADGDTPTLIAASRGHPQVLALLVDAHGANLDAADARGASALHKACQARQPAAASVLLEWYGVPADRADPSGTTPLHLAARGGDASLAELLTGPAGRADPGLRDGDGNQALHIAAACGHLGVVKVMVEKAGADLDARNATENSALDVAVGKANTEIADYLRGVLPDGGKHHDGCDRRAGFKRAGRWMGLARASGYLQDLSLENVYLLPVPTLLKLGKFPSHYDASRKKLLVKASDVPPHAQVLLVSHPCESPGNPDPSGRQFSALRRFLDKAKRRGEEVDVRDGQGTGEGEGGGGGFGYAWMVFSCTSANRIKPTFKTHLHNVITAWCLADHAIILPETVTVRRSDGLTCTDLMGYVERGWCCVELMCASHLGVPITVHMALGDGLSQELTNCGFSSPAASPRGIRNMFYTSGLVDQQEQQRQQLESRFVSVFVPLMAPTAPIAVATTTTAATTTASVANVPTMGGSPPCSRDSGVSAGIVHSSTPSMSMSSSTSNVTAEAAEEVLFARPNVSVGTSVGRCVSRAVELASKHHLCRFAVTVADDETEEHEARPLDGMVENVHGNDCDWPVSGGKTTMADHDYDRGKSQDDIATKIEDSKSTRRTTEDPTSTPRDAAADGGRGEEGGGDCHSSATCPPPPASPLPQESDNVLAIADLLWSAEAERYLDSISDLVTALLKSLDDEAAQCTTEETTVPAGILGGVGGGEFPPGPTGGEIAGAQGRSIGILDGGISGVGDATEASAQLLARILGLGLGKQDVEEDLGEVAGVGTAGVTDAVETVAPTATVIGVAPAKASPMLRELYDKLGSFSSAPEKVEAVNTLLLAGCYCRGVCSVTGGSKGSPKRLVRGNRVRVTPPPPPPPTRHSRPRSPRAGGGEGEGVTGVVGGGGPGRAPSPGPVALAHSVPSCRVS